MTYTPYTYQDMNDLHPWTRREMAKETPTETLQQLINIVDELNEEYGGDIVGYPIASATVQSWTPLGQLLVTIDIDFTNTSETQVTLSRAVRRLKNILCSYGFSYDSNVNFISELRAVIEVTLRVGTVDGDTTYEAEDEDEEVQWGPVTFTLKDFATDFVNLWVDDGYMAFASVSVGGDTVMISVEQPEEAGAVTALVGKLLREYDIAEYEVSVIADSRSTNVTISFFASDVVKLGQDEDFYIDTLAGTGDDVCPGCDGGTCDAGEVEVTPSIDWVTLRDAIARGIKEDSAKLSSDPIEDMIRDPFRKLREEQSREAAWLDRLRDARDTLGARINRLRDVLASRPDWITDRQHETVLNLKTQYSFLLSRYDALTSRIAAAR